MLGRGWSTEEISGDLADKMDRSEGAIERKALRPKRRTINYNIYASAGLSIRPKTKTSTIELIKEYVRALGVNPEEVLTSEALLQPARTYVTT